MAESKVDSTRDESAEKVKKSGGTLPVAVPDKDNVAAQDRALQAYKVTGVTGDYVDPTRDQEWDIAPEFGVAPHPELHNVSPSKEQAGKVGLGQPAPVDDARFKGFSTADKVLPLDEKEKRAKEAAKDRPDNEAEALAAGRPDLRGNAEVARANEEAKDSDKKDK